MNEGSRAVNTADIREKYRHPVLVSHREIGCDGQTTYKR